MLARADSAPWVGYLRAAAFTAVLGAALALALFPLFPRQLQVHEGDVASRDLTSPRDV
jgi:hypothetical protein